MATRAYVMVILDGAADLPAPELHLATPLELASTPNLDWFASRGSCSLVEVLTDGRIPQSHTGVLSLLGYDLTGKRIPRGPIEALGHYGDVPDGCLCARCNFAFTSGDRILSRRVFRDLTQHEADLLAKWVEDTVVLSTAESFSIRSVSTYRLSLIVYPGGTDLSDEVSGTDPSYSARPSDGSESHRHLSVLNCRPTLDVPAAAHTARLINEFSELSHTALSRHPLNQSRQVLGQPRGNYLLSRDFGLSPVVLESLTDKHGLSSAYICRLPIGVGLAKLLGMELVAGCSEGESEADYGGLGRTILDATEDHDLVVVHVKGPDEPGHDGDWRAKAHVIEQIDRGLFSVLRECLDLRSHVLAVTADHATPWSLMTHSADRVPLLVVGRGIPRDDTEAFSESACFSGGLPVRSAAQLLPFLTGR